MYVTFYVIDQASILKGRSFFIFYKLTAWMVGIERPHICLQEQCTMFHKIEKRKVEKRLYRAVAVL